MTTSTRLSETALRAIQRIETSIDRLSRVPQLAAECAELRSAVQDLRNALPPSPEFVMARPPENKGRPW